MLWNFFERFYKNHRTLVGICRQALHCCCKIVLTVDTKIKCQAINWSKWLCGPLKKCKSSKLKFKNDVLLEIPANVHSPFCPNSADFSACVPPALQKGIAFNFNFNFNFEFDDLNFFKGPMNCMAL